MTSALCTMRSVRPCQWTCHSPYNLAEVHGICSTFCMHTWDTSLCAFSTAPCASFHFMFCRMLRWNVVAIWGGTAVNRGRSYKQTSSSEYCLVSLCLVHYFCFFFFVKQRWFSSVVTSVLFARVVTVVTYFGAASFKFRPGHRLLLPVGAVVVFMGVFALGFIYTLT